MSTWTLLSSFSTDWGPELSMHFRFRDSVAFWHFRPGDSTDKIAAFDLDQTLVNTKSGYTFARSGRDWKWLTPEMPDLVRQVAASGYTIVIFTNQGGVIPRTDAKSFKNLKERIEAVLLGLELDNVRVYAACQNKLSIKYRKPQIGMWKMLLKDLTTYPDAAVSYFVGDAAGRKKDHSDVDLGFAQGAGIHFYTPEEFIDDNGVVIEPPASKAVEPKSEQESKPEPEPEPDPEPISPSSSNETGKLDK